MEEEKNFDECSHDFLLMFSSLSDYDSQKVLTALSEMRKIKEILPDKPSIIRIFMFLASLSEDDYSMILESLKGGRKNYS